MRLAVIPPVRYLGDFSTSTHLVLAHLFLKSKSYRDFYKHRRAKGDFIILDNGCAELGESIGDHELLEAARDLRPNVLVCPDVLYDSSRTLEALGRFLPKVDIDTELMGVPQGDSVQNWIDCFRVMYDMELPWIGLSKYSTKVFGTRLECLAWIKSHGYVRKYHLLGLAGGPASIELEGSFDFVVSHDTAVPVKLGMQGLYLEDYDKRGSMTDDEYFYALYIDPVKYYMAQRNIKVYRRMCGLDGLHI